MAKTTLDGLPILTEQTYNEVLNISLASGLQVEESWKEKFAMENDQLYNNFFVPFTNVYPQYNTEIEEQFVPSYEMLRRQGEIIGIKLPYVSTETIKEIMNEVITNTSSRKRHNDILESENKMYQLWAYNVLLTFRESGYPEVLAKDCCDYIILIYQMLKRQVQKDR